MSTSLGFDEDRNKRPVPSRQADDAELGALLDVLARHGKFVQFIPAATGRPMRKDVQRMADLTGPRGRGEHLDRRLPRSDHPDWARGMLDFAARAAGPGRAELPAGQPAHPGHPRQLGRRHVLVRAGERLAHAWCRRPGRRRRRCCAIRGGGRSPGRSGTGCPRTMIPHKHAERIRLVIGHPAGKRALGRRDPGRSGRRPWRPPVRRARRLAAGERRQPGHRRRRRRQRRPRRRRRDPDPSGVGHGQQRRRRAPADDVRHR